MPRVTRTALASFTPKQLYDLVNDVPSYPAFLPLCAAGRILERKENGYTAEVEFRLVRLPIKFATHNDIEPFSKITMRLASGPFRKLNGSWTFQPVTETQTRVAFELNYEFAGRRLAMVAGPIFKQVAEKTVQAFLDRAKAIYER